MSEQEVLVLLRFVAGVLIGGVAVDGFFFVSNLGDNGSDPVAAPSSTTLAGVTTTAAATTTTEARWVRTGEARFEPTVVLPTAMSIDSGVATLEYELAALGPMRPSFFFEYGMRSGWIGEYGQPIKGS